MIRFYKVGDEYGFFSNFAPFSIFLDGYVWPTVEHYFQASKFDELEIKERIRKDRSPMNAAIEGRDSRNLIRPDWEIIKEVTMLKALRAKFFQHIHLKKALLDTGDLLIVEHTENDNYWADGGNGSGKNRLGALLMQIREEINSISSDPNLVFPPWIAFPGIAESDMFWRMGIGENYIEKWGRFFWGLNDKNSYQRMFPNDSDWEEAYN